MQTLRITESSDECKSTVVWFGGTQSGFPALHTLYLDVGMSDVLEGARHFPALRHLTYRSFDGDGGETYDDTNLEGCVLDTLSLDLFADSDMRHLCQQLALARITCLALHVHDDHVDLRHRLSPALHHLHLTFHAEHANVVFDYPFLRDSQGLRSITAAVSDAWDDPGLLCTHYLTMHHVRDIPAALRQLAGLRLALGATVRLCVSPV